MKTMSKPMGIGPIPTSQTNSLRVADCIALMMEAVSTFETLVNFYTTQHPRRSFILAENLKCHELQPS
jgi:hypothetical protein